jgi:cytochrome P450
MGAATTDPVRLPPAIPKALGGIGFAAGRRRMFRALARRYGSAFTLNLGLLGRAVLISDAPTVRDLFTTSTDLLGRVSHRGVIAILGPGSTFSLDGDEHRGHRKLLAPPLHGRRMQSYEQIIEEEVMREIATWPEGREFETLQPMKRITLNAILRTVFGAEGEAFDELRELMPPAMALASWLAAMPEFARRDLGRFSPWGRFLRYRRRYDAIIDGLIADARSDPAFDERTDVLSMLLQARYETGEPISERHLADELLTLLTAGHETTAASLAWAVERLRRHPRLLTRLAAPDTDELRQATIWEVLRTRPVVEGTQRRTRKRIRLGEWVIPENTVVLVSIDLVHSSERHFKDAMEFNPDRFLGATPDTHTWIPYGGGVNRCIGAAFANMEMNVALRTLLREFDFGTTYASGEPLRSRGVVTFPGHGGRAVMYRRTATPAERHSAIELSSVAVTE